MFFFHEDDVWDAGEPRTYSLTMNRTFFPSFDCNLIYSPGRSCMC